jgi:hypothetical protein
MPTKGNFDILFSFPLLSFKMGNALLLLLQLMYTLAERGSRSAAIEKITIR